ncbi:hypothetical protein HMI56_007375 [Coelomomyces lativittatus]|nr:hypothetical protein HMI56_007375 [Coelomomyces lativittatus]
MNTSHDHLLQPFLSNSFHPPPPPPPNLLLPHEQVYLDLFLDTMAANHTSTNAAETKYTLPTSTSNPFLFTMDTPPPPPPPLLPLSSSSTLPTTSLSSSQCEPMLPEPVVPKTDHRPTPHVHSEKKRRHTIRQGLHVLVHLLPPLSPYSHLSLSKATILRTSVWVIHTLQFKILKYQQFLNKYDEGSIQTPLQGCHPLGWNMKLKPKKNDGKKGSSMKRTAGNTLHTLKKKKTDLKYSHEEEGQGLSEEEREGMKEREKNKNKK